MSCSMELLNFLEQCEKPAPPPTLCFDIMELVGTQVEQIRTRKNYNKCMEELIQVRDQIIERGFMGDDTSPILKSIAGHDWCYLREWIYQDHDIHCGPVEVWSQDPESIIALWFDGCSTTGKVVDDMREVVSWKNTPEMPGFEETDWGLLYSITGYHHRYGHMYV